ncbi:hypothetical protein GCM10011322_27490 [Salinarimonas ramus]|uniref:Uncharacterized protein n=1 Tax=Salinarimonas ramus TaxID=690164 RepID=A0A917V5C6_9HYPH|nr:hypothetical protein GCM10011322_27490 [Salinarimonas ramus]
MGVRRGESERGAFGLNGDRTLADARRPAVDGGNHCELLVLQDSNGQAAGVAPTTLAAALRSGHRIWRRGHKARDGSQIVHAGQKNKSAGALTAPLPAIMVKA